MELSNQLAACQCNNQVGGHRWLVGQFILPSLPSSQQPNHYSSQLLSKAKFFHQLVANNHLTKDSD
jgi:hypothetical protein